MIDPQMVYEEKWGSSEKSRDHHRPEVERHKTCKGRNDKESKEAANNKSSLAKSSECSLEISRAVLIFLQARKRSHISSEINESRMADLERYWKHVRKRKQSISEGER